MSDKPDSLSTSDLEGIRNKIRDRDTTVVSFKRGGTVRKTGIYRLHKGEEVVPARKAKGMRKKKRSRRR